MYVFISNEARELRCVSFDATARKGPAHGRLAIHSTMSTSPIGTEWPHIIPLLIIVF